MASGKYEKKAPAKTIKTYRKFESQPRAGGKYAPKTPKHNFKMKKRDKQRILLWLTAASTAISIASAVISPTPPETVAQAAEDIPVAAVQEYQSETPEPTEDVDIYSIGIANYDAEITVDGKSYPIGNSFVIVSENQAITSDVHENLLKGELSAEDFKVVTQKTENEMADYVFCQIVSESGANVMSSETTLEDDIISTVSSGDYVLAYKPDYSSEFCQTLSISDGNLYEGYISSEAIKEVGDLEAINYRAEQNIDNIENLAMVDTSKDKYISLNMRSQPGQDVITTIPYGSFVQKLGETMQYGNKNWSLISYQSTDGTQFQGWVVTSYLSNEVVQEQPHAKVIDGINVNASGNVTGIDVSTISPEDLRNVLENGISDQTNSVHGTFDTSQLAGQINYVYIKLGASTYGQGDFTVLDYDYYKSQVQVCEELGVPYGFYYYSTAITEEEANMELDCIKQRLTELRQNYNMENNLLEMVVDIELSNEFDRQYQGDILEQTQAKAALINGIQEEGLSDNVLIYAPGRVMQPNLDQIFDLQYLRNLLDNPNDVALWQCSLMNRNGNVKSDLNADIAYAELHGFSTVVSQLVLDAKVAGKIDINNMDFNHFKGLIQQQKSNEANYSFEHNNEDDGR